MPEAIVARKRPGNAVARGRGSGPWLSETRRTDPVGVNPNRRTASHPAGTESCHARVTAAWKRRQGVSGPMCASPEKIYVAAAETFVFVEGRTGLSARARMVGAAGVDGIGTGTRVRLQPGRPSRFPRCRVGGRKGDRSARRGAGGSRIGPRSPQTQGKSSGATLAREGPDRAGRRRGDT
jgi:hypothetical protein